MVHIGIIGTGSMANSHADAYSKMKGVRLVACCDVDLERGRAFAEKWSIPAVYSDYEAMLKAVHLDGVSIVTPDPSHAAISIACLSARVPVLCEKPMASTLADARRMLEASRKSNIVQMVNYSKRNSAGLQAARKLIASGGIGAIKHVEASYLQGWLATPVWGDWRKTPRLTWRLSKKHGSLGVLGDLGCHIYDMATFLCGDIAELYCRLETFDKGIPEGKIGEYDLDANDSFISTVTFGNGALGTVHSSRWAVSFVDRPMIRVHGDEATVEVDLSRSWDDYYLYKAKAREWKTVRGKKSMSNYERFIHALKSGKGDESDFENAYRIQVYLEYSMRSNARRGPITIDQHALEAQRAMVIAP